MYVKQFYSTRKKQNAAKHFERKNIAGSKIKNEFKSKISRKTRSRLFGFLPSGIIMIQWRTQKVSEGERG